ncbi:hypothetical protein K2Z84_13455 [Candidatus Binatia bacterium]|jgi:hypothetical protein|nr:hypothetical protein [Candidatus Binatia bacterium]
MRSFVKSIGPRARAGWLLPLLLLALPNCALQVGGIANPDAFDAGPVPESSAIMCDIPKVPIAGSDDCADSTETGLGMSQARAAVALVQGEQASIVLDLSAAAEASCGGLPKKTEFQGPWPDGYAVCLNCAKQIPGKYADGNAACVAMCVSLLSSGGAEPPGGAQAFCAANAHVATNFDPNGCYADACSNGGTLRPDFVDPRRAQEPVVWTDLVGTSASGNDLSRISASNADFDAGAASKQTITHGDAWVEFEANENDLGHIVGLSPDVGTDVDPSSADVSFGIRLGSNGKIVVFEDGAPVGTSLGLYSAGDRFRVQLRDNLDGTATVTYVKLNGACTPGTICSTSTLATAAKFASYPVRVDASLRDTGATLKNVTLVRIQ